MKLNATKFLYCIIFGCALWAGCNKAPDYFELVAPADQMKIQSETDTILLDLARSKQEAIKFVWNTATDRGKGTGVSYNFRLFQVGNKSTHLTEWVKLEPDARTFSYTHQELNNIIRSWDVSPGDLTEIAAEVVAQVTNADVYMKPEISLFEFSAAAYDSNLYLFYTTGESILRLQMKFENDGIYTWTGELPIGEFWFSTNKNTGYPAYMRGSTDSSLAYQEKEEGTRFTIDRNGIYEIRVELEKMQLSMLQLEK